MPHHFVSKHMGDRALTIILSLFSLAVCLSAQTTSGRVTLTGNIHPAATAANDQGRADASLNLSGMLLMLKPTAAQQADLENLLSQQQDPTSPNYHKWLTPEQYAERFGRPQADVDKITAWLSGAGLSVGPVARGRNSIMFSGNVRTVESAFATEIHRYNVKGESHFANSTNPSVPSELAGMIQGVHGLNDFKLKPRMKKSLAKYTSGSSGFHSLAPDDIAAIYDIKPILDSGITGAGQKLVIVGQTDILLSDIASFRGFFNLPANPPQIVLVPGSADPGIVSGDQDEANLDIEFSGAVARNATVIFVTSTDVVVSAQYAINNNLAPVVSMSYGDCESDTGLTGSEGLNSLRTLAQQGNAQGITWMAASGDAGAADCYVDNLRGNTGAQLAVDAPGSIPEVTSVGGTEMNEGNGTYFAAANNANHASVSTYIPEMVWNDSAIDGGPSAGGGGASAYFAKPTWQVGTGVPADGARDVPDISFTASADHDPMLFYSVGSISAVGGTSCAAPTFAGIVTLLNQYMVANGYQSSPGLGNINPRLYSLAQAVPEAFHDITVGNNIVNGCTGVRNCNVGSVGYNATVAYDQASGLGSVDAFNLITSWHSTVTTSKAAVSMTLTSSTASVQNSASVTLTATVTGSLAAAPTGTVNFLSGGSSVGTATVSGSTATLTVAASKLTVGFDSVSAEYSGDSNYSTAGASVSLAVVSPTAMSIQGVTNAASYYQAFSGGELMSIFGTVLSGSAQSAPVVPLPTTLGGTTVSINGTLAPLLYVSPSQINLQIPYGITPGIAAAVTVTYNSNSVTSTIPISSYSPGIFVDSTGAPAGFQTAKRGSTIALYITGQGAVSSQPATGALPASGTTPVPQNPIYITVGGVQASTNYAYEGIPAWAIGLTQINFTIPAGAPLGPQQVLVSIGGATSAPATINITN